MAVVFEGGQDFPFPVGRVHLEPLVGVGDAYGVVFHLVGVIVAVGGVVGSGIDDVECRDRRVVYCLVVDEVSPAAGGCQGLTAL